MTSEPLPPDAEKLMDSMIGVWADNNSVPGLTREQSISAVKELLLKGLIKFETPDLDADPLQFRLVVR